VVDGISDVMALVVDLLGSRDDLLVTVLEIF